MTITSLSSAIDDYITSRRQGRAEAREKEAQKRRQELADDPLALYLSDILTLSANLAGIPGMSVPCGFSSDGLPIGMQLQASHFNEEILLRAAYNLEQRAGLVGKKPVIA